MAVDARLASSHGWSLCAAWPEKVLLGHCCLQAGMSGATGDAVDPTQCRSRQKCTSLLLPPRRHGPTGIRFCAVDCSAEALRQTERSLGRLVPGLPQEQVRGRLRQGCSCVNKLGTVAGRCREG